MFSLSWKVVLGTAVSVVVAAGVGVATANSDLSGRGTPLPGEPGLLSIPAQPQDQDGPLRQTPVGGLPFPKSLDTQPGMRRRSGGPYVSVSDIRSKVSEQLKCGSTHPLRECNAIVVKFFARYEDAATAHIKGGTFASGLASDREVYLVSVKGQLDMASSFRVASADGSAIIVDHWNYTIDATTGDFASGGTAGDVLD